MTAKTDLENAFSILDAGITAHVTALKASKAAHAVSQAAANDDTYLTGLTTKVLSWADTLSVSLAPEAPVAPATLVAAPVLPPAAQVAAQVAAQPVVPPPLPASVAHDPGATPAMIAAAIAAQAATSPSVAAAAAVANPAPSTFAAFEAALGKLIAK